jgi:hypothetical protein
MLRELLHSTVRARIGKTESEKERKLSMKDIQHERLEDHDFYFLKNPPPSPSPFTGLIPLIPLFEIAIELPVLYRLFSDVFVLCPRLWILYL